MKNNDNLKGFIKISQEQLKIVLKYHGDNLKHTQFQDCHLLYIGNMNNVVIKKFVQDKYAYLNTKYNDWLIEPAEIIEEKRFIPVKTKMVEMKAHPPYIDKDGTYPMPLEDENIAEKIKAAMDEVLKPYEEDEENLKVDIGEVNQEPMTEQGFNITFQILIWKKETAKA